MTSIDYTVDQTTGIAIVQPNRTGLRMTQWAGVGTITYRCHSCGELIPKWWDVFYWDPESGWAGYIAPAVMPSSMTTHHDWHLAATQEG